MNPLKERLYRKKSFLLRLYQASPACPFDYSSSGMKTVVERLCKDSDREEKNHVFGEKEIPVPPCPLKTPCGQARERPRISAVRGRRATASTTWRLFET